MRTADWRYTRYPNGTGEQLFHLAEDPDEQHNLAGDPAYATVRNELCERLLDLVILQDYPTPTATCSPSACPERHAHVR